MPFDNIQLGHYKLLNMIGSGGMGEVYLAEDTRVARKVAIKIIRAEATPFPDSRAMQEAERLFQREMKAITQLDHPRILPLYDFGETQQNTNLLTYMVMPYRPEGSLTEWLRQQKETLTAMEVANIINQAADALQHAHQHHIVHQDVKPSNFLIRTRSSQTRTPDLLLADFGIAKFTSATSSASQNVRGTPAYMAPEQWDGQPVAATDQYALGIMAYQLLVGRTPFVGRMEQVMRQHFTAQPSPPSTYNPKIPPALDVVILRALAKNPVERFPSIAEFARAFQQAAEQSGDLRATLAISHEEAASGAFRTLTLPGGRQVPISVPAGISDGQVIRYEGLGEQFYEGGPRGPLLLKLVVSGVQANPPVQGNRTTDNGMMAAQSVPSTGYSYPQPSSNPNMAQSSPSNPGIAPPPPYIQVPNTPAMGPYGGSTHQSTPHVSAPNLSGYQPIPQPEKRSNVTRVIILAGLAIFIIVAGVLGTILYQNKVASDNATATVTAQENLTATANAQIQATQTAYANPTAVSARATATVTAFPDYAKGTAPSPNARLIVFDALDKVGQWSNFSDNDWGGLCNFADQTFHVSQSKPSRVYSCYSQSTYANFFVEVHAKITKGDCGGIDFRYNTKSGGYTFFFCQNGTYSLNVYTDNTNNKALTKGNLRNFNQGYNQDNTIGIKADGSSLVIFINGQSLDSTIDSAFTQGNIGLIAYDITNQTEVEYTNARIWSL